VGVDARAMEASAGTSNGLCRFFLIEPLTKTTMKFLCPIDFSENALNAVEFASQLAKKHQASLTLMHVYSEKEFEEILSREYAKEQNTDLKNMTEHAEQLLDRLAQEVNKLQRNHQCNTHLSYGSIEDEIIDYTTNNAYDLVIMGIQGLTDAFERYVGSTTMQIMEKVPCPVIAIPKEATYQDFRKVVYATDYQEEDKIVLKQLISWVMPFRPEISIVHFYKKDTLIEEAVYNSFVDELKSYFPDENLKFIHEPAPKSMYLSIHEYIIHQDADMLALLHHHRSFIDRIISANVTQEIAYAASYPVMIFKED
jgi:nucleotide-binding universal stress UspA family protein